MNYTIIRPHNVIGIYQNIWDKYRNVIGIWIRNSINNEPINIYGDGLQKRAFSDIKFYMEPFEKMITGCYGETFNIGADQEFELNNVAEMVKSVANKYGFYPDIKHLEPRHEVKFAYCDHSKAKDCLNFIDNTKLEKTIEEMFIWAMKEPKREVRKMKYEIEKNIYHYWK